MIEDPATGNLCGPQIFQEWARRQASVFRRAVYEPLKIVCDSAGGAVEWRARVQSGDGTELAFSGAAIVELAHDSISRISLYYDVRPIDGWISARADSPAQAEPPARLNSSSTTSR